MQWESSLSLAVTFLRSEISSRATSEYSLADLTILRATCWLVVLREGEKGRKEEVRAGEGEDNEGRREKKEE